MNGLRWRNVEVTVNVPAKGRVSLPALSLEADRVVQPVRAPRSDPRARGGVKPR
jgi:hypothetical protein